MSSTSTRRYTNKREQKRQFSWIDQTLGGIASTIERSVFSEEHARNNGWLQRIDPRAKWGMFVALVLSASLSNSLPMLIALYLVLLVVARASRLPFDFFVRRVWLGIPFFAGIVIVPAIFFTTGNRLFDLQFGPWHLGPSIASLLGAATFVMRVGDTVSLAVLLILTTPWAEVLKSLQALYVSQVFILLLSMTYRYIFLFLHIVTGMFDARKSRTVGRTTGNEQRKWISGSMMNLMNRSFKMSSDVYAAMCARGFKGEMRTYSAYSMRPSDWLALLGACALALVLFLLGGVIK
jgi:cobalt/nickel transport system permease protein